MYQVWRLDLLGHLVAPSRFLDVMMGTVYSPEKFFLQLKTSNEQYDLDDLQDAMEDLYSYPPNPALLLPSTVVWLKNLSLTIMEQRLRIFIVLCL